MIYLYILFGVVVGIVLFYYVGKYLRGRMEYELDREPDGYYDQEEYKAVDK